MSEAVPETLHLTLLRHGRSRADDEGVHEGRYDSPLTEIGQQQAHALAAYWVTQGKRFDNVISSSLCRASETAAVICQALELSYKTSDVWQEFDNGPLAGLARDVALEQYPPPTFRSRYAPFTNTGGETQLAFRQRAQVGLSRLWQSPHTRVLVVAHGGILNEALKELLGVSRGSFAFGDTAFAEVRVYKDQDHARLLGVNLQPHLTDKPHLML
ncbi:MAG: histidine phosphatase family protein [Deinococcota bacterium]